MKILVIGGSGLLGSKLKELFALNHDVKGTYFKNKIKGDFKLDISNRSEVFNLFEQFKPEVVIHSAAMKNILQCEKEKKSCYDVNVSGTKNVADAASKFLAKMVFISSYYIFDGKNPPYTEGAKYNPVNYYGKTKVEGEKYVKKKLKNSLILRCPFLYGFNIESQENNFLIKLLEKIECEEKFFFNSSNLHYPLLVDDVALAVETLLKKNKKGIFNLGTQMPIKKSDFFKKILTAFDYSPKFIFVKNDKLVERPYNPMLNTAKIKKLGVKFRNIEKGIESVVSQVSCPLNFLYLLDKSETFLGNAICDLRRKLGKELARKCSVKGDLVLGVPESGVIYAEGFLIESGIPFRNVIKSIDKRRSLLEKTKKRNKIIQNKFVISKSLVKNKNIILIDEAIFSGETISTIILKLKELGAKKIHVRTVFPKFKNKCDFRMFLKGKIKKNADLKIKKLANSFSSLSKSELCEKLPSISKLCCKCI